MSVRQVARRHLVSEAAVRKRAKAESWVRRQQTKHVVRDALIDRRPTPAKLEADLIEAGRGLAGRLMDELDAVTSMHGELVDMIHAEESDPRRRQGLLRAISLGERAKTLKDISATAKMLNEAGVPEGKKAQRQKAAEDVAAGGKFAPRSGPRLAIDNS